MGKNIWLQMSGRSYVRLSCNWVIFASNMLAKKVFFKFFVFTLNRKNNWFWVFKILSLKNSNLPIFILFMLFSKHMIFMVWCSFTFYVQSEQYFDDNKTHITMQEYMCHTFYTIEKAASQNLDSLFSINSFSFAGYPRHHSD